MKIENFLVLLFVFLICISRSGGIRRNYESVQSRTLLPDDPYRTGYHFQPPQNWMNDPNGPMYYMGVYHLFYQYNPYGAEFGDSMVWAHSVSYDLINWIHLNLVLEPTESFDINSCWSGSVTILGGNNPVILYTGINATNYQVQNLATPKNLSDPYLREWVKFSQNPVINTPNGIMFDDFRDPTTGWRCPDGKWRVIIGSQRNKTGMAILYKSDDFIKWTKHESPLYLLEGTGIWECPDFFPVSLNSTNGVETSIINTSVKHVLKVSYHDIHHDCYFLGTYNFEMETFIPGKDFLGTRMDVRYDYGKFYASKTFFDSVNNRRILWGWVNESDSEEDEKRRGWSGMQSIPRSIWLDTNRNQLVQWPIEEIESLHGHQVSVHNKKLRSGTVFEVSGITASQVDVEVSFQFPELVEPEFLDPSSVDPQILCSNKIAMIRGKFGPFGLLALASKDLAEQTAIFFRIFRGTNRFVVLMCSDQSRSSLRNGIDKTTYGAFLNIDPRHEKILLRSLIDHSIVESFGGKGRTCITSRVYPTVAIGKGAHLFAFNNGSRTVEISSLNAWSMKNAELVLNGSLRYDASLLSRNK